jgi:hypothetical protein
MSAALAFVVGVVVGALALAVVVVVWIYEDQR